MKRLSDGEFSELWWLSFRSQLGLGEESILSSKDEILARLRWEGRLARIFPRKSRQASVVTGDGAWTLKWLSSEQFAAIYQRETGEEIATFSQQVAKTSRPPDGLLKVHGGRSYIWETLDHHRLEWRWLKDRRPLVVFKRQLGLSIGKEAKVEIMANERNSYDLSLLVIFGWFLVLDDLKRLDESLP